METDQNQTMCFATAQHAYILRGMAMGWATLSGRLRAMGLRMLTQRLSKNMVGKCMHVSGGAGEAAAIWKCESYGSGVTGGGGIPEADSDADGVAAVAQGNRMGNSNSQPFRGVGDTSANRYIPKDNLMG